MDLALHSIMKLNFVDFKANYPETLTAAEQAAFWK
jgi:hypothetical protein